MFVSKLKLGRDVSNVAEKGGGYTFKVFGLFTCLQIFFGSFTALFKIIGQFLLFSSLWAHRVFLLDFTHSVVVKRN